MKSRIILLLIYSIIINLHLKAQDIVVKTNNSRVFTHVLRVTDSIVSCKGFDKKSDTLFTLKNSDLKMIIFEIGNIQYFNEKKSNELSQDYSRPIDYNSEKNNIISADNLTENYMNSLEIGGGFTASIFSNYPTESPFQINLRAITKPNKKSSTLLGVNLNYSNKSLLSQSHRYSAMALLQFNFNKDNDDFFYLNLMGGIGYFDGNANSRSFNGIISDMYLPMAHIGLGGKHFFANKSSGVFYEAGLGGPYLLNVGVFFY